MDGVRILLVDDEGELVFTVAERLTFRGYRVDALTDGREAVDRLQQKEFDVAVVDLKMPGMGGLSVLKAMKGLRPSMPVIMLTGHGSREDGEEGMRQGAFAYLFKPVDISELMETVNQAARRAAHG